MRISKINQFEAVISLKPTTIKYVLAYYWLNTNNEIKERMEEYSNLPIKSIFNAANLVKVTVYT